MKKIITIFRILSICLITVGAVSGSIAQARQLIEYQNGSDNCGCHCCCCQNDNDSDNKPVSSERQLDGKCACHMSVPEIPHHSPTDITLNLQVEKDQIENPVDRPIALAIYSRDDIRYQINDNINGVGPPIYILSSVLLI